MEYLPEDSKPRLQKWNNVFSVIGYYIISKVIILLEACRESNAVISITIFSMWLTHWMLWLVSICHLSDSIVFQIAEILPFPWCFMNIFNLCGKHQLMWILQKSRKLFFLFSFFFPPLYVVGEEERVKVWIRSSGPMGTNVLWPGVTSKYSINTRYSNSFNS